MSNYATKTDVSKIVDKAVDDISTLIKSLIDQTDQRFNTIETQLGAIETSHQKLINTIDGFVKRIDEQEIESAARDNQFQRLLEWARKVSEKTGIPLENL